MTTYYTIAQTHEGRVYAFKNERDFMECRSLKGAWRLVESLAVGQATKQNKTAFYIAMPEEYRRMLPEWANSPTPGACWIVE